MSMLKDAMSAKIRQVLKSGKRAKRSENLIMKRDPKSIPIGGIKLNIPKLEGVIPRTLIPIKGAFEANT